MIIIIAVIFIAPYLADKNESTPRFTRSEKVHVCVVCEEYDIITIELLCLRF